MTKKIHFVYDSVIILLYVYYFIFCFHRKMNIFYTELVYSTIVSYFVTIEIWRLYIICFVYFMVVFAVQSFSYQWRLSFQCKHRPAFFRDPAIKRYYYLIILCLRRKSILCNRLSTKYLLLQHIRFLLFCNNILF